MQPGAFLGTSSTALCRTSATLSWMTRELTQRELRNQSGEIMRALDRGEDFVVTRNGVPVGELRPIGRRQFVRTDDLLAAMAGAEPIDVKQFFADIDAYVDQDPTPRVRPASDS
jgi:antitoxin (DNA-binding transcriptional repressor) of toxin-antitoxin stability system